jgi:hypothetical protein
MIKGLKSSKLMEMDSDLSKIRWTRSSRTDKGVRKKAVLAINIPRFTLSHYVSHSKLNSRINLLLN